MVRQQYLTIRPISFEFQRKVINILDARGNSGFTMISLEHRFANAVPAEFVFRVAAKVYLVSTNTFLIVRSQPPSTIFFDIVSAKLYRYRASQGHLSYPGAVTTIFVLNRSCRKTVDIAKYTYSLIAECVYVETRESRLLPEANSVG